MNSVNNIICGYTKGTLTLEEANAQLKETRCGFHLDPMKNVLTDAERENSLATFDPKKAHGWGLLDTGTASLDKVEVREGQLVHSIGEMFAIIYLDGATYQVRDSFLY